MIFQQYIIHNDLSIKIDPNRFKDMDRLYA